MKIKRYLIPIGAWLALLLGLVYLLAFGLIGGKDNLALSVSLFATALSVRAYGNSFGNPAKPQRRRRK